MPSKQQDGDKPKISPVLFMTVDGEPMSFFLRPGPVKRNLQPLITSGGGRLCSVQQPGAILLIDPEERGSVSDTAAHWYVSTQYIYDCIEKDEQLNVDDYRLNPEVVPRQSARLNTSKDGSPGLLVGRAAYTAEEDAAILSYVSKHKSEIGGNRLWQEMEKQHVTSHSWQSMKYRYRVQLAKRQPAVEEVKTTEVQTMEERNQGRDVQEPSSEDAAPPQTHSADTDLTQIEAQPTPAESSQPENVEAQASNLPEPGGTCLDPQTDAHPAPAEGTEPETAEPQTTTSPQKDSVPEDSLDSLPDSFTPKKPKEKQRASPRPEQLQRRSRRQLELEASPSPEPYGKRLRSSATSAEKLTSSPQSAKKTNKTAAKPAFQKHITADLPPAKRARGRNEAAAAESQQQESEEATVSETPQPDEASNSLPQKGEKKKQKRRLGILELATKEFEDESESSEDEAADLQNPTEKAATSTEPVPPPSDTAAGPASAQSNPEPAASEPAAAEAILTASRAHLFIMDSESQEEESQSLVGDRNAAKSNPEPGPSGDRAPETGCTEPTAAAEAVHPACRAHLFIFESQEEDSQSVVGDGAAAKSNPQPLVNEDAAESVTQVQLEEDMQRLRELMNQTNQDLVNVTKALLKTSGNFSAARDLLMNPSSFSGPFWTRCEDDLLLSADPDVHQQLQEKYGEEEVAKRIVFLEVEG
ncbi:telomeric repeat-binding factor 2-interacting protein 1 [Lates japonicus]|uniref:Telomeric repeat-binding factor 2-interacting protein 1 n=1 Tax=Lates japonicus TaxID=270547 RepID=A0AAD3RCN5_LATJO|nr:telomeric repeat-binding factor 2-interacting protein 1 [Lates japonicus]